MERLELAIHLRKEGNLEESRELLKTLIEENPHSASAHYHCAWTHDNMGLEREAAGYYEKAIHLGLDGTEAESAYIGLGSTYRTIGEYDQSRRTLETGLARFPTNHAMKTFLAMTYYNSGEHAKAMEILLLSLATTSNDPEIIKYRKALEFYSNRLDEKW